MDVNEKKIKNYKKPIKIIEQLKSEGNNNEKFISNCLKEVSFNYRPYDPGWYLYRELLKNDQKFKENFLELVYVTLSAWNMNSRGAKLSNFDKDFKRTILKYQKKIGELSKFSLERQKNLFEQLEKPLKFLFNKLVLIDQKNKKNPPKLVTFSKTLHFFLPNLIIPIDRKYTLNFFFNQTTIGSSEEEQFKRFLGIQKEFHKFMWENKKYFLSHLKDSKKEKWNANLPKILDNFIIGYKKLKDKDKVYKKIKENPGITKEELKKEKEFKYFSIPSYLNQLEKDKKIYNKEGTKGYSLKDNKNFKLNFKKSLLKIKRISRYKTNSYKKGLI